MNSIMNTVTFQMDQLNEPIDQQLHNSVILGHQNSRVALANCKVEDLGSVLLGLSDERHEH